MAAPDRLPPIPPSAYTPEQEEAAADFRKRRGVEPFGPYAPLMRSPKVMIDVEALGRRLRYGSCLSEDLKEMAICQVARSYSQQFEWSVHAMEAEKAGVSRDILAALADGRRPEASAMAPSTGESRAMATPAALVANPHMACPSTGLAATALAKKGA